MMSGWKTWVAGVGSILWGIVGFVADVHNIETAAGFITGGMAILGIGHKIEKSGKAE